MRRAVKGRKKASDNFMKFRILRICLQFLLFAENVLGWMIKKSDNVKLF
jgi:hypothetical protein